MVVRVRAIARCGYMTTADGRRPWRARVRPLRPCALPARAPCAPRAPRAAPRAPRARACQMFVRRTRTPVAHGPDPRFQGSRGLVKCSAGQLFVRCTSAAAGTVREPANVQQPLN